MVAWRVEAGGSCTDMVYKDLIGLIGGVELGWREEGDLGLKARVK